MSVLKFNLTEQHIALVKNVSLKEYFEWEVNEYKTVKDFVYEDFGLILYGNVSGDFDPTSADEADFTKEQKEEMDTLFNEIPQALQIMLQTGSFEAGNYKTKHHDINWKKI